MKVYQTVEVPASTKQKLVKVTCDLCGNEIKRKHAYDATETEIRHKTGSSYPEGGSGTESTVDMCSDCWRDKFLSWLASFGAKPETKDWDW